MDEEEPLHEHVVERRQCGDWPRARLRDGGGEEAAGFYDEAGDQLLDKCLARRRYAEAAQEEEAAERFKPVIEG